MSSSLTSTYRINKRHLSKLPLRQRHHDLPPIRINIRISNLNRILFILLEIHVHIIQEGFYWDFFVIEEDPYIAH